MTERWESHDADESEKHLEARDRRYLCLKLFGWLFSADALLGINSRLMKLPYKSLEPLKSTFQILVRPLYLVKRSPAKAKTKDSYFTLSLRPVVHN